MCGIIGYSGKSRAVPYLLKGLGALEYRGYDSAGIALSEGNEFNILKAEGRLSVLESLVASKKQSSALTGMGHTRWATHGEPTVRNCHPHLSRNGKFAVVHNGIIENAGALRHQLMKDGYSFTSDTDTEVIPQLFERYYDGDLIKTALLVRKLLQGAYALCIMSCFHPDEILCMRFGCPLVAGKGNQGAFIASDSIALSGFAEQIYKPQADELVLIKNGELLFFDGKGRPSEPEFSLLTEGSSEREKKGYSHYMLKEIYEQPAAVRSTLLSFMKGSDIVFPDFNADDCDFEHIYLVGCGSAYHAALSGKQLLEEICHIPCQADIASEFRYRDIPLNEKDLCIFISQSGETADTISALKKAKEKGCFTLGIVNVKGSSIADMSDRVIYTSAGPEIAVATTKAYLCQLTVLILLAVHIADRRNLLTPSLRQEYYSVIAGLPALIKHTVTVTAEKARLLCEIFTEKEHAFFIGRGSDYPIALEGALKLKEISYIHAEAYAAGELKHGTISLIEPGTTVVALMSDKKVFSKTLSNVREVKARGARVIALSTDDRRNFLKETDRQLFIPHCHPLISPCLEIIPLQLLAYFTAVNRNCDVDNPRNLAKSVTVE